MKSKITLFIIFVSITLTAQVGIGTDNPQTDLHVAGDMLIRDNFVLGSLGTVDGVEEDFKLITMSKDSEPTGLITKLDVDVLNVAPVNVVKYEFVNISSDNLTDLDLQYDANKYVVGIANFRYLGDAIKKVNGGGTKTIGNFVVHTFISGGTWHLEIRNRDLDLDPGDSLTYELSLVIYDKSYFRFLAPVVTDLEGRNNGNASAIPNLY